MCYIPIDFMTELVVARVHDDGAKSDGKGKEALRYSCIPNLNRFYFIVPVPIFLLFVSIAIPLVPRVSTNQV